MPKPDTAAHFSHLAEAYARSAPHASDADLDIVADFAAAGPDDRCLDIACGPGHTAFRIAATGGLVVTADIAPGMLAAVRRLAAERGLSNVVTQFADAAALPFPAATFDLVTCRIAPHHFPDVPAFTREVARVLTARGRFVLEDSLAPDDRAEAAFLDELERRRDPTHIRSLSRKQWFDVLASAGLRVTREHVFAKVQDYPAWLRRTGLDPAQIAAIDTWVAAAPAPVRAALFDTEDGRILRLHDRKIILHARLERAPA